ncbi:MAG: cytochrome c oxidase subunit II, partial [Myxococcota bacterium]|nr:cytochrome c oxidase subunit II [Myxococcota bacterium]
MIPGLELPTDPSVLAPAGDAAAKLEQLWWAFLWPAFAVWLLVLVFVGIAVLRGPAAILDPLRLAEGTRRRLTRSVAVATGLTVLVLLGFLFASSWYGPHQSRPVPGSLSVKLGARQWWWRIEYPGKTPSETVVTANELHLPAGRTVVLTLGSVDVVHSLWIPELSGKRDLIPGRVSDLVIRAERPGVYRGQCAEFCGAQHAHMGLLVFVEPPATFERWLAAQRAPARAPET